MAQASYLISRIRALFTDARPKSSTNPIRALSGPPSPPLPLDPGRVS